MNNWEPQSKRFYRVSTSFDQCIYMSSQAIYDYWIRIFNLVEIGVTKYIME